MHIAIVIDYSLDLVGGAQRAALNSAAALAAAGHGVLLVAPRPADPALPPGVRPYWTDARRLPGFDFPLLADDEQLRAAFARRFRAERIDAVHVHSEFGHAGAAIAAARRLGVPVLHTVHTAYWPAVPAPLIPAARHLLAGLAGPVPAATRNPLLDQTLATAHAADVVLSPSAHQARDLAALGIGGVDAGGLVVLPNCAAGEAVTTPLPSSDALRVAWIGRCVPEKRLLAFLAGVRSAQRRLPADGLRVTIAGDGPLRRPAQLLASGVPGLTFVGRLAPDGVRALIAASHLTALTSFGFDNQPMTVVESVRAGRGVLHVDPRLTEGLDTAGLLTAGPDADGIADLLVALAADPARVRRACAGAAATDVFSPARHAARIAALVAGCGAGAERGASARREADSAAA